MRNTIRVERAIKEISQEALADAVNVSRQTITYVEKNKYAPSVWLALRIARYFGKTVDEIFILEEGD